MRSKLAGLVATVVVAILAVGVGLNLHASPVAHPVGHQVLADNAGPAVPTP
jgi:hypothetical protein